ncbi:hypothetical protein ACYOEI_00765 [Singulisphaera rosea]
MTLFNVHIYREMRLSFEGIEADSPEAAATIAHERPTGDADGIDDCDGEDLGALVDVVGDETFEQSVIIDFAAERLRKAAPDLLAWSKQVVQLQGSGASIPDTLRVAATLLIATLENDPTTTYQPEPCRLDTPSTGEAGTARANYLEISEDACHDHDPMVTNHLNPEAG